MAGVEDPFFTVKSDVESAMQSMTVFYESWKRLLSTTNTSTNQEFQSAALQIQELLKSVEFDLNDLEETVAIVEQNPHKFKLDAGEIQRRKQFINVTKAKVKEITDDMASPTTKGKLDRDKRDMLLRSSANQNSREVAQVRFERQMEADNQRFLEQNNVQMLVERQDHHLDAIGSTVAVLKQQAVTIGDELDDQAIIFGDVEQRVDSLSGRLKSTMNKMGDIYKKSNEKMSFWLIGGLVIVIVILVVLMMFI